MGTIDNSNNIEAELQKQLKETSLSENEINEIVPKILELINLKENIENKQTETSTQNFLLDLRQDITNNSNVAIDIKKNKWTVIWTIEVNNIRNDIHITVNGPQTELKSEQPKPTTTVTEQKPTVTEQKPTEELIQKEDLQRETQNNLQQLQQEIQTPNIDYSKIRTADDLLSVLDQLLDEIRNIEQWISKKSVWSTWREGIKSAKTKLKQYKEKIKGKKKSIEKAFRKWSRTQVFESDINEVKNLESNIKKVNLDLSRNEWNESSNESGFLYNSPENARKSNIQQERLNEFEALMKEEVKKWAILRIFNWQEKEATDFYRKIAEWRYGDSEYNTYTTNAAILNPSFQRCGINIPILTPNQIQTTWWTSWMWQQSIQAIDFRNINRWQGTPQWWIQLEQWAQTTRQRKPKIDYSNMDLWEAFQAWGLAWVLDKALSNCKNMTPWQRDAWKSIGVLWGYAAWIFWLYKFFTNKNMSFRGKAWITAATIFWAQALTWEWPITLFTKAMTWWFSADELQDKFWNAFWDAVTWISNSWMECAPALSWSMYSMMIFNSTTTVWDIRAMTASFRDNNAWKAFRENAINKLKSKYGENSAQYFSSTFPDTFNEQQRKTWLASFWITDTAPNNTTNVYEIANNASMNELIIEKFKEQNWVKETSNEVKKKEYINHINNLKTNNQVLDIKTLEDHPEWFELDKKATYTERQVDKDFKTNIESKIDTLPIDEPKKSELKSAIKRFYDERSIEAKPNKEDFSLKMDNDLLILTSHKWQETKINIKLNEIEWFWRSISFTELSDLLNTADLANKILDIQKWKKPKGTPVFQSKTGTWWRWIYFNDASTRSFDFDTRVLSWGWWWTIWKIDTLSEHPDEFAEYLSNRRTKNNKVEINATTYPILQNLSKSWIEFFNEEEAKQAETRLNQVKQDRNTGWSYKWYKPFSIEWNKLVFTRLNKKKIYYPDSFSNDFSGKIQDLSNFPTIIANKDKFLAYMNNQNNWMRWSALKKK